MAKNRRSKERGDDNLPDKIWLDTLAVFVHKSIMDSSDRNQQRAVLTTEREKKTCVAILLDGIGSSSDYGHLDSLIARIEAESSGFEVRVFSYKGKDNPAYIPKDTVETDFYELVELLDEYVKLYSDAECVVLIGYSLGGVIATQWLHNQATMLNQSRTESNGKSALESDLGVSELILIASPVLLNPSLIDYEYTHEKYDCARSRLDSILGKYTADPTVLHEYVPLTILRCDHDGVIHNSAFKFDDCKKDNRRFVCPPIQATHRTIATIKETQDHVIARLNKKCEP